MKALIIKAEETTPEVIFDPASAELKIGGRSYSANPTLFFDPLIEWLAEYQKSKPKAVQVEFNFDYFNSSSQKEIARLIRHIHQLEKVGSNVAYTWMYEDDSILDVGEMLSMELEVEMDYVEV